MMKKSVVLQINVLQFKSTITSNKTEKKRKLPLLAIVINLLLKRNQENNFSCIFYRALMLIYLSHFSDRKISIIIHCQ